VTAGIRRRERRPGTATTSSTWPEAGKVPGPVWCGPTSWTCPSVSTPKPRCTAGSPNSNPSSLLHLWVSRAGRRRHRVRRVPRTCGCTTAPGTQVPCCTCEDVGSGSTWSTTGSTSEPPRIGSARVRRGSPTGQTAGARGIRHG